MKYVLSYFIAISILAYSSEPDCVDKLGKASDSYTPMNGYIVNRPLDLYDYLSKFRLISLLRKKSDMATEKDPMRWGDFGAGTAQALRDFFTSYISGKKEKLCKLLGIAYKKPRKGDNSQNDNLEPIDPSEVDALDEAISTGKIEYEEANFENPYVAKEKLDVATDFYGPLTYVKNLRQALQNEIDALTVRGDLLVLHHFDRLNIVMNGTNVSLGQFLQSLPGLEVTLDPSNLNFFSLKKLVANVTIPELENLEYWGKKHPPYRSYRVVTD